MRNLLTVLVLSAFTLAGCGPKDTEGTGGGCSGSATASAGPEPCASYGDAGAGEPCHTDCDCCGQTCSILTAADGTMSHVCAAPCIQQAGTDKQDGGP